MVIVKFIPEYYNSITIPDKTGDGLINFRVLFPIISHLNSAQTAFNNLRFTMNTLSVVRNISISVVDGASDSSPEPEACIEGDVRSDEHSTPTVGRREVV